MNRKERRDLQFRPFSESRRFYQPEFYDLVTNPIHVQGQIEQAEVRDAELIGLMDAPTSIDAWNKLYDSHHRRWLESGVISVILD